MNRRVIIIAVVVIVIVVVFGLLVSGFLSAGLGGSMSVQFNDKDGRPLYAFYNPAGQEVSGFTATVTWVNTGIDYDPATLNLRGEMDFYLIEYTAKGLPILNHQDSYSWTSGESSGSESSTWDFATWLDTSTESSWEIRVVGNLDALVKDKNGDSIEVQPWSDRVTFTVTWQEDSGTYSIVGTITFGYP